MVLKPQKLLKQAYNFISEKKKKTFIIILTINSYVVNAYSLIVLMLTIYFRSSSLPFFTFLML